MLHLLCLLAWLMVALSDELSDIAETPDSGVQRETLTFELEHAFGESEEFTKRADVVVEVVDGKPVIASRGAHQIPPEMIDAFKELLRHNGLYKLRIKADPSNSTSPYVHTSIPSCRLQNSAFKEDLALHVASGDFSSSTFLVGLVYSSPVSASIARTCNPQKIPSSGVPLKTKVYVAEKIVAQSIPLQAQGPRPIHLSKVNLGASVDANNPGASQKKSFFMQYWYIILPIAVIALMGGGDEPPKKGGGTSSSGCGASAQSTSS